jgi:hypothetical protein
MMMMLMNKGQSTQLCPLHNEQHILHTPNDLAMIQHILQFIFLSNQKSTENLLKQHVPPPVNLKYL